MKRKLVTIAGIAVCLLLGGCSLLKKEEEYHVLRIDSLQDEQRDEKIAVVSATGFLICPSCGLR